MFGKWRNNSAQQPALQQAGQAAPRPRRNLRTAMIVLLGGAGVAALLTLGNDSPEPATENAPDMTPPPVATTPRNPNAGKYMPLVLYVDGAFYPYAAKVNDERMASDRARDRCLQGDHADGCFPVAMLTRKNPGCIAYARDTQNDTTFHLHMFHRAEDNTPFATGNPTVSQYFCNDPILERELQDGVRVSAPRPSQSLREVFADEIRVLTEDVYLAFSDGKSRGGPLIVEGSCVEISTSIARNTGVEGVTYLVTAWEKGGNGNNRTGFIERGNTRPALEGEYTPQTCYAVFGPNAPEWR